jgi:hypothetical protein
VRSTTAPYTESRLTRSVANERVGFPVVEHPVSTIRGVDDSPACCGKGDRNESTNVSISKLIIGTKPKPLIWSAYYRNKSRTFQSVPKLFKIKLERFGVFLKFKNETRTKPS